MDNACESLTEKGGETGASEETAAAPGGAAATDTEGIPEEAEGEGDADLKEASLEESQVGLRPEEFSETVTGCSTGFLVGPCQAKVTRTRKTPSGSTVVGRVEKREKTKL